jgi:hypothetical protein
VADYSEWGMAKPHPDTWNYSKKEDMADYTDTSVEGAPDHSQKVEAPHEEELEKRIADLRAQLKEAEEIAAAKRKPVLFASEEDARRELEKMRDVLEKAHKHLVAAAAANAALHMNDTVRPSPLAVAVETQIDKINELLGEQ